MAATCEVSSPSSTWKMSHLTKVVIMDIHEWVATETSHRFHNGQTMSLGVLLATSSTYYLLRPTRSIEEARDSVFTAALIGTFYCLAGCTAILYPGTHWWDPEFSMADSSFHQGHLFSGIVVLMWIGYGLEMRRLGKVKDA